MSIRYCKQCGTAIKMVYGQALYECPKCNKSVQLKDLMPTWTFEARRDQLEAMHNLMTNANDENIYMSWICLMPDGAEKEDFEFIALRDDLYNECFDLFIKLVAKNGMRW